MLIITSIEDLGFESKFDQPSHEVLNEMRACFESKYGKEVYGRSSKIIVMEKHFYNIIKDKYGPPLIGEHVDGLWDDIDSFLSV